ncbi:MAG: transporter substrate-binding domain-containing protein [Clostridia bacterium]|nr:transporter substrate-binding domain-containing protein [Clostridia bacterium]
MKRFIKMLFATILASVSLLSFACCNGGKNEEVLKVGYTIYAPMNYTDEKTGEFVGFDTDLAKEVGKIINKKIEFVEINWDNKVLALNGYEIDCVWNGMTITEDLEKVMAITKPYLENKQVVVCQKEEATKYTSVNDIEKAGEVFVESGSAGESVCKNAGFTPKTVTAQKDTLLEVASSPDKIAVIDLTMARVLTGEGSSFSSLTYVDVGFETELFGIGFRKVDEELKNSVQNAIDLLKENGTFDRLLSVYFS